MTLLQLATMVRIVSDSSWETLLEQRSRIVSHIIVHETKAPKLFGFPAEIGATLHKYKLQNNPRKSYILLFAKLALESMSQGKLLHLNRKF